MLVRMSPSVGGSRNQGIPQPSFSIVYQICHWNVLSIILLLLLVLRLALAVKAVNLYKACEIRVQQLSTSEE